MHNSIQTEKIQLAHLELFLQIFSYFELFE